MKMTHQLLALQLDPNRRDGWEMDDGREEARQGGGGKRGSAPGTKLRSRERNSSDLKTILLLLEEHW